MLTFAGMTRGHFLAVPLGIALSCVLSGCGSMKGEWNPPPGHLLIIGGGLDDDVRSIYERFIALASKHKNPRIVLALTATEEGYDERSETSAKLETLRAWAPGVPVDVIRRETPASEVVEKINRATGILFTGGDQSRIISRYHSGGRESSESLALRGLLERGGVIAGCSAGDTMMGRMMILHGDNAKALTRRSDLQVGTGMGFLPWSMTESHFFERNRLPRLVASLEKAGRSLGIGVGEDAAVEVDLARGTVKGVSEPDSLLVDMRSMQRDGDMRRNVRARLIQKGDSISLTNRISTNVSAPAPKPDGPVHTLRVASPSQHRQLALWRLFKSASQPGSGVWEVFFDEGWRITAWPDGRGEVIFDIGPASGPRSPELKNIES